MTTPAHYYAALAALQVGQATPSDLYILDYDDGARPAWTVVERQELEAGGLRILLQDLGQERLTLFDGAECPQLMVLSFPAKTLRTPIHLSNGPQPGQLCDQVQQARYAMKRGWR